MMLLMMMMMMSCIFQAKSCFKPRGQPVLELSLGPESGKLTAVARPPTLIIEELE